MKKLMMGITACALVLSSCSKNEVLESPTSSNLIGFSNLNDRPSSRAANETNSNFGVYAVRVAPNNNTFFFDNQQVSGVVPYSYSPMKIWPGGDVDFYAYAPYNSATLDRTAVSNAAGSLTGTVSYTVPANADEDLTFAAKNTKANGVVDFEFSHMLSKVELVAVKLVQELIDAGYVIATQPTLRMMVDNNKGDNDIFATPLAEWRNVAATTAGAKASYTGAASYYIMPQPSTNQIIQLEGIEIKKAGQPHYTGDILAHKIAADVTVGSVFKRGTRYGLTITLGFDTHKPDITQPNNPDQPGEPLFDIIAFAPTITAWTEENLDMYATLPPVASPTMSVLNAVVDGRIILYHTTTLSDNQMWDWSTAAFTFENLGMGETATLDFTQVDFNGKIIDIVVDVANIAISGTGVTSGPPTRAITRVQYTISSSEMVTITKIGLAITPAQINALTTGEALSAPVGSKVPQGDAFVIDLSTPQYTFAGLTKFDENFTLDFTATDFQGGSITVVLPDGYVASAAQLSAAGTITITRKIVDMPTPEYINGLGDSETVLPVGAKVVGFLNWDFSAPQYTFAGISQGQHIVMNFAMANFAQGGQVILTVPTGFHIANNAAADLGQIFTITTADNYFIRKN